MKNDITTNRSMYDVLRAPDRLKHEVKGVSGALAFLWRSILEQRNIGLFQFDNMCANYIRNARRMQTSAKIANYFNRSNIFREFSRPTMTFKVFVKGLQLIGIRRLKITVDLEGRGFNTRHTASIVLDGEEGVRYEDLMEDGKDDENGDQKAEPAAPAPSAGATGELGQHQDPQVPSS